MPSIDRKNTKPRDDHLVVRNVIKRFGDVVVLDKRVGEPLDVLVGEKTKMKGMPGRVNRRLAIKITEVEEER